jgi:hypothetical protein
MSELKSLCYLFITFVNVVVSYPAYEQNWYRLESTKKKHEWILDTQKLYYIDNHYYTTAR